MGVDPWVDSGVPTFWSGMDALCFVPSPTFGVWCRHF